MSQGATTLDYRLRTLVPSFNVATHPISGAASLVRPASLRNLAHDHTLVLVNGKRRHRSAILVWFGGVTDGTRGLTSRSFPRLRCARWRCCATAPRRSTARTPLPAC